MRTISRLLVVLLSVVFLGGPASADVWVAPLPSGSNLTGDGSENNPYATISHAYTQIPLPGETIRVKPGQYFDHIVAEGVFVEVSPGVFEDKWVDIVAEHPDPAMTTLTGDFVNEVARLGGSAGSLQGFTIIGGRKSGVIVTGGVSIINNVFDDNEADFGGGLRVRSDTCLYGPTTAAIVGNTFINNLAFSDGGGAYVSAGVNSQNCQNGPVALLIEGNTFTGNAAGDDGGGMELGLETFPNFESADVTVRDNVFTGNTSSDEAGGLRAETAGEGTENLIVQGNTFDGNSSGGVGGGMVTRLEATTFCHHRVLIDRNVIINNDSLDDAGGMMAKIGIDTLVGGQVYSMIVSNNLISNNVSSGIDLGGGGVLARYESDESMSGQAELGEFKLVGNTISYNEAAARGGGLSVHALTNRSGGACQPTGFQATAKLDVESNLIVRNNAILNAPGGGAFVSLESCLNSVSTVDFLLNTFSKNDTGTGGSAIHATFFTDPQGATELQVSHSILWDNSGGKDLSGIEPPPGMNHVIEVDHSDVEDYEGWIGDRTGSDGNISVNPKFVNSGGDDFHLQASSPAVESGSRLIGPAPPADFEGSPRVVDADGDGWRVADMGADERFLCTDADQDGFGSPVGGGDQCALDNCESDYNPGQSDCDGDTLGDVCDVDTVDADGDGVDAVCDIDDNDPETCADLDADGCDDCASGVAYPGNDGPDFDFDGLCNTGDPDDDADGAPDNVDDFPFDPFSCGDADNDGCGDDCPGGIYSPGNDGPDYDGDGQCNVGDPDDDNDGVPDGEDADPLNEIVCADTDSDNCDDCTSGAFDPLNDGTDVDGDGRCAAGDSDDADPAACADDDADGCDDCSYGQYDLLNDGPDNDLDGICDDGDPDDDNDSVADEADCAPLTTGVSAPVGDLGPTLRLGPGKGVLHWLDVPSSHVFNIYRGLYGGEGFVYSHTCHIAETPGTIGLDPFGIPPSSRVFFYLISGKNSCGEGTLGSDSFDQARPNDDPCPSQFRDFDDDGIFDIDDNCVKVVNPAQTDADGDTSGDSCDNCPLEDNVTQEDFDDDDIGDLCDLCTDTDGDGRGNPGFPGNTCPLDNCPDVANSGQFDGDGDGIGSACDPCPSDPGNDLDEDGVCFLIDNCPELANPGQLDADADGQGNPCDLCTDTDGDGAGNPAFPANECPTDNCPDVANPTQADADGDLAGDVCDTCTDSDGDGSGDPGFPLNECPEDNCPTLFNPGQTDLDGDGIGDPCDPCFANPDLGCLACPPGSDLDGDGSCQPETLLVTEGSEIDYRANPTDPGIVGIDWVAENYVIDGNWLPGVYGVGYESSPDFPNASELITTSVDTTSQSIYTRATFHVANPAAVQRVLFGVEYDDGATVWLNGVEIYRSAEIPAGDPEWDTLSAPHESSNASDPIYDPILDVTAAASDLLNAGPNLLAVGVWNTSAVSSDLVLIPQLSILTDIDNCPGESNPGQEDLDGDGLGDACDLCTDADGDGFGDPGFPANTCPEDNCPAEFNPEQEDGDTDGAGDICDVCPTDPTDADEDGDGICSVDDNCPTDDNPGQEDADTDLVGDVCDNCPDDSNQAQDDADTDGAGDVCDLCTDLDGDGSGDPGFPVNTCPEDNCPADANPGQQDADADLIGDACDACYQNPDPGCVACPDQQYTDPDGDGVCEDEIVLIEEGTATDYLANASDPGIPGIDWVAENYVIDGAWQSGVYGLGYDTSGAANGLITTAINPGTRSVYTRTTFDVADVGAVLRVVSAADWDDAYALWINGTEVFRSAEMPGGIDPAWNEALLAQREPSNAQDPVYDPLNDVTTVAIPLLNVGPNVAAIGIWNATSSSSDLVLVPRLSIRTSLDNCPDDPNPGQEDTDDDGIGDACDLD